MADYPRVLRDLAEVVREFRAAGGVVETYLDPKTGNRCLRVTANGADAREIEDRWEEALVRIKPKELERLRQPYHDWDQPAVPFAEAVKTLATSNEGAPDAH